MFDWKDFFNDFADRYYSVPDFTNEEHVYALQNYLIEQGMLTEDVDFAVKVLLGEAPTDPRVKKQAKKLGLVSKGYGNWGKEKDGPTTHTNVDGKLEPVSDEEDDDKKDKEKEKPKATVVSKDAEADREKNQNVDIDTTYQRDDGEEQAKINAKRISKELYGRKGKGPLLQDSETSQQAIDNGYVRKSSWVAPGNAGSNYNENLSNEGALILEKYPDATEDELARVIYNKTSDTKLGNQQKNTVIKSEDKIKAPDDIEDQKLWKSAKIAARSAKRKNDRAKIGAEKANLKEPTKMQAYGGTRSDLDKLEEQINSANDPILIYDDDKVYKVPKDTMIEWVKSSGGGENAADTAMITTDKDGNLLYDGWSDKKTLNDIQGNSTLNDDFNKAAGRVDKLLEGGRIDSNTREKAIKLVDIYQNKVADIEEGYGKVIEKQADWMYQNYDEQENILLKLIRQQDKGYKKAGTKNHWQNFQKKVGMKNNKEALEELIKRGREGKLTKDESKLVQRLGTAFKNDFEDKGQETPDGLDTDKILSKTREEALDAQRKLVDELNGLEAKTRNGVTKKMGDMLGFQEAIEFLHLDKIDEPKDENDHKGILRRNTQLVMEGVAVNPKKLKDCMGVKNLNDAEDNFQLQTTERLTKKPGTDIVTGKVVYIFAVNKEGKSREIGQKTYRSKEGPTGKTQNTIEWSNDMQECFDSKRND
tara:strand:- start:48 stop:2156 length:2109 start_codon:yes stop_codon:yes gene_type:complete